MGREARDCLTVLYTLPEPVSLLLQVLYGLALGQFIWQWHFEPFLRRRWPMRKERSCPVCGDMTCGCIECFNPAARAIVIRYGVCRSCDADVGKRIKGNTSIPGAHEGPSLTRTMPDRFVMRRVVMKLQEFARVGS